ncbi:MAG: hypothetical protein NC122_05090 [Faecalibacterium sp.]|nr:hypothetical protein [Ruminococcus sp.]MCM1391863.1 hypothetical protein [Ruminococcus sp.]MCM1485561.1 hypothetical protein [Faecalibacterium sp.]
MEIDSIELEIKSGSSDASKNIKELATSLSDLYKEMNPSKISGFVKSLKQLNSVKLTSNFKQLKVISKSISGFKDNNFEKVAKAIKKLDSVKISNDIPKKLKEIKQVVNDFDSSKLENLATVLSKVSFAKLKSGASEFSRFKKKSDEAKESVRDFSKEVNKELSGTVFPQIDVEDIGAKADIKFNVDSGSNIASQFRKDYNLQNDDDFMAYLMRSIRNTEEVTDSATTDIIGNLSAVVSKIGAVIKAIKIAAKVIRGIFNGIKKVISSVVKVIKDFTSAIKSALKIAATPLKIGMKSFDGLRKSLTGPLSAFKQLFSSLKRIATYRLLRTVLKEISEGFSKGLENAYTFSSGISSTLANSLDKIATSALYFKNSIGAAAAPLINALAPAVDYVIDKCVDLVNWFNQLFATLTGQTTWMKATKTATKYAEATDKATKANKAFKASILGIDEINALTDNSDTAAGNNSDSSNSTGGFTIEKIGNSVSSFANALKAAWEEENFEAVGIIIQTKLVDMMNNINWNSIYSKASDFGKNLASFLNGLFKTTVNKVTGDRENIFTGVGQSIAGALNTALEFLNTFGEKFDFSGFGTSISLGITKFLTTINWKTALSASSNWGKGVADALNDFIAAKDKGGNSAFSAIGSTVANLIKTAVENWYSFVKSFDFGSLGIAIGNSLNNFIKEMNAENQKTGLTGWESVIDTVKLSFQGLATAVSKLVYKIDWKTALETSANIGNNIANAVNDILEKSDFTTIGKTVARLVKMAITSWNSFIGDLDFSQLGVKISDAINSFIYKMNEVDPKTGFSGWDELIDSISKTVSQIGKAISSAISGIDKNSISDAIDDLMYSAWAAGWNSVIDKISENDLLFWVKMFKVPDHVKKDVTERGEEVGKTFTAGVQNSTKINPTKIIDQLTSKDAKKEYTASGSTVASSFNTGFNGYKFNMNSAVKNNLYLKDKVTYTSSGSSAASTFNSGFKGYKFNMNSAIKNNLYLKDKVTYTSSGSSAASSFNTGFKNKGFSGLYTAIKDSLFGKSTNYTGQGSSSASSFSDGFQKGLDKKTFKGKVVMSAEDVQLARANTILSMTVNKKADGGFVPQGQMFIAREAGPELVGSIGGKTAVVNNDQIVQSVSNGVYAANQEQNALLRQQNALLTQMLAKNTNVTAVVSTSSITSGVDRYNRRVGKIVIPVGA